MKVLLIDQHKISKYNLPEKIEDSFVISYKTLSGKDSVITLEANNNNWVLKSNGSVNIFNGTNNIDEINLIEYSGYLLKFLGVNNYIVLYAMPTVEPEMYKLDVSNMSKLTIGSDESCNIRYKNSSIHPIHAEIVNQNGMWYITGANDKKYQTFLNNTLVQKTEKLSLGDVIFINGFKLIWMDKFVQINNPNKQITVNGLNIYTSNEQLINTDYKPITDEEQNVDLYSEEDYFYHIPRVREFVEIEEVIIDAPPKGIEEDDTPFLLTMGSTITMAASSLMMGYNVSYSLISGTRTVVAVIPQLIMCFSLIVGTLIMPRLLKRWRKKKRRAREKLRQEKYSQYLMDKEQEIDLKIKKQVQIMKDNSLSVKNCSVILSSNNRNFWCKEIGDDDFLKVRLGIGTRPSPIIIKAPEKCFSLDKDNLLEKVYEITDKYKKVDDVPIDISLIKKNIVSFICECSYKDTYIDNIIFQLVTLHSAADLKIVILTDEKNSSRWEYMKHMPHCWSEDKSTRFFATTQDEMKTISAFLENDFKNKKASLGDKTAESSNDGETKVDRKDVYKNFDTYYLIINDNYHKTKNIPFISRLLKMDENYGYTYMVVESSMRNLPTKSKAFVQIGETDGAILEKNINASAQIRFKTEYDNNLNLREVANKISNIPLMTKEGLSVLPSSLSFLEMYNVSKVEQLNVLNRWTTNSPVNTLATPVGVHTNGELFKLNLHEKFHGPHGLIAGSTGSGKSEFIITYILSMCINYHPHEVQFVLIDYKGGGLAGAFENKETGVRIPHLTGTITNLDTAEMNRTLVSIESELKRRQRIFNETRDALGESTIDIYKYQRLYREGQVKEPLAHLFIISDEFAELKSQQPDFMQQLISTARIGRSLGVHLILATQKPSGVVNAQIWSNSKFKVCLKVQDRSDSMEMLKRPEAASLKEPGRFYLQVGYNDFFDIGQSGWAGAKYVPTDRILKKIDDSIDYVNNTGEITKTIKDLIKNDISKEINYGDQLTNIVKYIYLVSRRESIKTTKLWLDAIPSKIFIDDLKKKYSYQSKPYFINPIIGEYDSPATQEQNLLTLDLTHSGNSLIMGEAGSGKENLITTIIWSTITEHTPEEVNFYIIDCGTEALKVFRSIPHVGDVASVEDREKAEGIFEMLFAELERRKDLMVDYAGSYTEYLESSGKKLPLIVTVINNYEVFLENYGKMAESVQTIYRDGGRYGIIFIISELSPTTIKSRMMQNFPNKLCLRLPNDLDYRNSLNAPRGLIPAKVFGRGISFLNNRINEFQTAFFTDKKNINNAIRELAKVYNETYAVKAKRVPTIPDVVYANYLYEHLSGLNNVPIGYNIQTKMPSLYNFSRNTFNIVLTNGMNEERMDFVYALMRMFQKLEKTKVKVIDFVEAYDKDIPGVECFNNDFNNAVITVNNEIIKNKDSDITTVYFLLGVGGMKKVLSPQVNQVVNNLFSNVSSINNAKFVFVDVLVSYRNIQVESWYRASVDSTSGIWLDKDAATQLVINVSNVTMDERKLTFPCIAYSVNNGKHTIIKHMVDEKESDSNEK